MELDAPAPARRVVSRSPVRTVRRLNLLGIFEHPVDCESSLERDFVLRAALCPSVIHVQHQPFRLELPSGRRYTPDFLIRYRSGARAVVEVKPHGRLEPYAAVFEDARTLLAARGIDFQVLTEIQIRAQGSHERAAMVLRYRKAVVDPAARDRILACLAAHADGLPLGRLLSGSNASHTDVLILAACRAIRLNSALALNDDSYLFPTAHQEADHEVRIEDWFDPAQR